MREQLNFERLRGALWVPVGAGELLGFKSGKDWQCALAQRHPIGHFSHAELPRSKQ